MSDDAPSTLKRASTERRSIIQRYRKLMRRESRDFPNNTDENGENSHVVVISKGANLGLSGSAPSPGWGHCVLFLSKALKSRRASPNAYQCVVRTIRENSVKG